MSDTKAPGLRSKLFPKKKPANRGKVQVLFINGCDAPHPTRYRVIHQMEQLESLGVTTDLVHYTDATTDDGERADIIFVYRCPLTGRVVDVIVDAQRVGKPVYFDIDDLVLDTCYTEKLPFLEDMNQEQRQLFQNGVFRTGQLARLCDYGITTTAALRTELLKYLPEVSINRNVASKEMVYHSQVALQEKHHDDSEVVIGYFSGSITHNEDFKMIVPAIAKVMEKRPNVVLAVVGEVVLPEDLLPFSDRVRINEFVEYAQLPKLLATADINLAPVEQTLFNEAKSENKWMEAALVKVPTVATDFGAFAEMVEDGATGLLCSNEAEWESALLSLIDDPSLRETIAAQAYEFCMRYKITENSGYPIARLLLDLPATSDNLMPHYPSTRDSLVTNWLSSFSVSFLERNESDGEQDTPTFAQRKEQLVVAHGQGKKTCAIIYERNAGDAATFRYFAINASEACAKSNAWSTAYFYVDELSELDDFVVNLDAAVLVRMRIRPDMCDWVRRAHANNVRVAYLIDDDVANPAVADDVVSIMATDPTSSFEKAFWHGCCERFNQMEALCDASIVTLPGFAKKTAARTGKPAFVVHNSLNESQIAASQDAFDSLRDYKAKPHLFTVGYFSGTASHDEDLSLVAKPLAAFMKQNSDARLLMGGHFTLPDDLYELWLDHRISVVPAVDYITLQYLQASCDVVLAPLVINNLTNCKSALKVFEAGAVGTPAIASPSEAYSEAIDQSCGWLCSSAEEWESALNHAYRNSDKLLEQGQNARRKAVAQYGCDALEKEWCDVLDSLMNVDAIDLPADSDIFAQLKSQKLNWDDPFAINPLFANQGQ